MFVPQMELLHINTYKAEAQVSLHILFFMEKTGSVEQPCGDPAHIEFNHRTAKTMDEVGLKNTQRYTDHLHFPASIMQDSTTHVHTRATYPPVPEQNLMQIFQGPGKKISFCPEIFYCCSVAAQPYDPSWKLLRQG